VIDVSVVRERMREWVRSLSEEEREEIERSLLAWADLQRAHPLPLVRTLIMPMLAVLAWAALVAANPVPDEHKLR
jgi:hypothetical protein